MKPNRYLYIALTLFCGIALAASVLGQASASQSNSFSSTVTVALFARNNFTQTYTSTAVNLSGYTESDCYYNVTLTGNVTTTASAIITYQHAATTDFYYSVADVFTNPFTSTVDFTRIIPYGAYQRIVISPTTTNPMTASVICAYKN